MSRILFRHRPHAGGDVELCGDMLHWSHTWSMTQGRDGYRERALELDVGVYEYKFRQADGQWCLDGDNTRTRCANGAQNNVLVVGGAGEPVLHAPVSPWLFQEDDGRICIRAAVRRSAGQSAYVRWDEGAGMHRSPMRIVGEEPEHWLLEAHVPGSGKSVEYWFEVGGQIVGEGGAARAFHVERKHLVTATQDWWRDAVVYSAFVDRFRLGRRAGAWPDSTITSRDEYAGGDLWGVAEAVPHLASLGVTALHLTPICIAGSVHRYDCIDPRAVAPELGGDEALDHLIEAAHNAGIRILLDVTVTHVHRDFFAFQDVRERGEQSEYWDWFEIYSFPFSEGQRPGYRHYQKGQWEEPLLRTEHPEVADYLVGTFEHWAKRGVDGFRIDAAADVDPVLCGRIAAAVKRVNPQSALFGEVIPENGHRWTAAGLDAVTDMPFQQALYDWLWRKSAPANQVADVARRRRFGRGGPGWRSMGFVGTHDQPRIRSLVRDPRAARLALLLTLMRAPVPMLYYGDEVGLASADVREFEDSWPDRQCMPWRDDAWDHETLALVRDALNLRRTSAPLRRGDEELFVVEPDVLGLRRSHADRAVDVIFNRGQYAREVALRACHGAPHVALGLGDVSLDADAGNVMLGPVSAVVVEYAEEPTSVRAAWGNANAQLAGLAYRNGLAEVPSLPTRLYLTATEACNLRCAHCITDAPARTRDGRARYMRPWVLDALGESIAAADYFAFTHGGESLVAPGFLDILDAIANIRGRRPGQFDVHLATNGLLLDQDWVARLVDRRVTSLMVSLDGATAAVNDAIRIGGRFERVIENVRGAVAYREAHGADLRIGISTVVGRSNVAELPEFASLCADLGVDWLKVEETYPASSFARRDFIEPDNGRVTEAMAGLRERLQSSSIVLVDHMSPSRTCVCGEQVSAEHREFRDADDYANRARFRPCRSAWEQACVDPDGAVRPVDYAHAPLGNLVDSNMWALWNSHVAQQLRLRAIAETDPAQRERCVARDSVARSH